MGYSILAGHLSKGIADITSSDGSISVGNPTGPTTDLKVVSSGGSYYASLTGNGKTVTPGDLIQAGGFAISTSSSSSIGISIHDNSSYGINIIEYGNAGIRVTGGGSGGSIYNDQGGGGVLITNGYLGGPIISGGIGLIDYGNSGIDIQTKGQILLQNLLSSISILTNGSIDLSATGGSGAIGISSSYYIGLGHNTGFVIPISIGSIGDTVSFMGKTPQVGPQVSGGTLAGVIAGLVALGLFSS